jgi:hypothetical protein
MIYPGCLSIFLLLFAAPMFAWAQAGQENPAPCAKCHVEGRTQPDTDMAHALEPVERDPVLVNHPDLTATYGKYTYHLERKGDQTLFSVTDGTDTLTMPIRYAMGASSALGQTFILEKDGKLYESRLSWFRELNRLGPTLGAQTNLPVNLNEAAGRLLSEDETQRCFGCHATNAVSNKQLTLEKMTPGVQCSHCHEAVDAHLAALVKGSGKPVVPKELTNLHDLTAEQAGDFCGRCHHTWSDVVNRGAYSINNVRFQPYRLWGSLCYDPDDARISCVACHDPHKEVSAQLVDYDAKCQACHSGGKHGAKTCPASKNNCVSCHMPKTELPGANFKFTDHRIRVVKANQPYPR